MNKDIVQVKDIVQEMVTSITPELWYLFLQMLFTVCVTLFLYQLLKNIAAYIMVRFDRELSKNVKIILDGEECRIVHINIRYLVIKKSSGNDLFVPISKVSQLIWEIIKD